MALGELLDPDPQLVGMERLDEVVVSPLAQAPHPGRGVVLGGEHEHRDGPQPGTVTQGREQVPARDLGHHDVEDDGVGVLALGESYEVAGLRGGHDLVVGDLEDRPDREQEVGIVIDCEDLGHLEPPAVGG